MLGCIKCYFTLLALLSVTLLLFSATQCHGTPFTLTTYTYVYITCCTHPWKKTTPCASLFIVQTHSVQDVRGEPHVNCSQPFTVDSEESAHCALSSLLRLFSFNAASSFSVSAFLKTYESEFLKVVNAKHGLIQLQHKDVIPASLKKQIEAADEDDARYLLFEHLEKNTTLDTLRAYCDVASAAGGYAQMKELVTKMKAALPA